MSIVYYTGGIAFAPFVMVHFCIKCFLRTLFPSVSMYRIGFRMSAFRWRSSLICCERYSLVDDSFNHSSGGGGRFKAEILSQVLSLFLPRLFVLSIRPWIILVYFPVFIPYYSVTVRCALSSHIESVSQTISVPCAAEVRATFFK